MTTKQKASQQDVHFKGKANKNKIKSTERYLKLFNKNTHKLILQVFCFYKFSLSIILILQNNWFTVERGAKRFELGPGAVADPSRQSGSVGRTVKSAPRRHACWAQRWREINHTWNITSLIDEQSRWPTCLCFYLHYYNNGVMMFKFLESFFWVCQPLFVFLFCPYHLCRKYDVIYGKTNTADFAWSSLVTESLYCF